MRRWSELQSEGRGSVARALGDLYRRFQDAANARYADMGWRGLTLVHVQFLSELDEGGSMLSDIAAAMGTTKQYAGRLAKESADKGLISIHDNPNDRRAVLVHPTDRGRAFLEDACAVRRELEDAFFEGAEAAQRQAFLSTLDAMLSRR